MPRGEPLSSPSGHPDASAAQSRTTPATTPDQETNPYAAPRLEGRLVPPQMSLVETLEDLRTAEDRLAAAAATQGPNVVTAEGTLTEQEILQGLALKGTASGPASPPRGLMVLIAVLLAILAGLRLLRGDLLWSWILLLAALIMVRIRVAMPQVNWKGLMPIYRRPVRWRITGDWLLVSAPDSEGLFPWSYFTHYLCCVPPMPETERAWSAMNAEADQADPLEPNRSESNGSDSNRSESNRYGVNRFGEEPSHPRELVVLCSLWNPTVVQVFPRRFFASADGWRQFRTIVQSRLSEGPLHLGDVDWLPLNQPEPSPSQPPVELTAAQANSGRGNVLCAGFLNRSEFLGGVQLVGGWRRTIQLFVLLGFLGIAPSALSWTFLEGAWRWSGTALGGGLVCSLLTYIYVVTLLAYRQLRLGQIPFAHRVSDDGLVAVRQRVIGRYRWSGLTSFRHTGKLAAVCLKTSKVFHLFPRRLFASDDYWQRALHLLQEHVAQAAPQSSGGDLLDDQVRQRA